MKGQGCHLEFLQAEGLYPRFKSELSLTSLCQCLGSRRICPSQPACSTFELFLRSVTVSSG